MKSISLDVETYSEVDLRRAGAFKYVEDDSFEILLLSYSVDKGPVQSIDLARGVNIPKELVAGLLSPQVIKHAWNVAFEWCCLSKHLGQQIPPESLRDTMLSAAYCGFPLSLEAAGNALNLNEETAKDRAGKALINFFSKPCKPTKANGGRTRNLPEHDLEKWKAYSDYNVRDTIAEMAIEDILSPWPVPDWLQEEWRLTLVQNNRGVGIDTELVTGALHCYEIAQQRLLAEAREITGLDNPNSVQQLSKWLSGEMRVPVDGLDKRSVGIYLDLASNTEKSKRALEIRQELGKSSVKKFHAMEDAACRDGRIRGVIQFYGAHTGRAAGRMIQTQNFPRSSVENEAMAREIVTAHDVEMLGMLYGSVPDTLSSLLRSALVPAPGNTMAACDLAAIEARVLAWVVGEEWVLDVFKTHGKIYETTASRLFKVPFDSIDKNSKYRQQGKVADLACGYGGSVGAISAMDFNNEIQENDKPGLVARWREEHPMTVQFWWDVDNAIKDTIQKGHANAIRCVMTRLERSGTRTFLTIELPSGRKLFYPEPYIAEGNFNRPAIWYWGINQQTRKWEPIQTYGPRVVENIIQAIARDVIYAKITDTEKAEIPIVFSVHDEAVADVQTDDADALAHQMEEIMCTPIPWAADLPLGAEAWAGEWYRK